MTNSAWQTGVFLRKGHLNHQTREDEHGRQRVKAQKWERVGLGGGCPGARCACNTEHRGPGGEWAGCLQGPSCQAGEMALYPRSNREMSQLCKWNKDMIRFVLFERSLWGDVKGELEGADTRGGDTCTSNCPGEK